MGARPRRTIQAALRLPERRSGIGSTDHVPFDDLGLPAANDARTRHTNADFPERMTEEELQQSAIFLAHFACQAAQREERIPRR